MKIHNSFLKGKNMRIRKMQIALAALLIGVLVVGFGGCKDKSDDAPADPVEQAKQAAGSVASTVSQTTCPIMGKPIDKSVSVEYQGQKVYFCCQGCIEKFKAEPEKYTKDLPQFKK